MTRPSWDEYAFEMAQVVSRRATCSRASIGCVIMTSQHRIIATGFNGAGPGQPHCTDIGCLMLADHCIRATHAEVNAAQQVSPGMRNLVAYVVGGRDVCSHCARELYAVGVREVKARPAVLRLDDVLADVVAYKLGINRQRVWGEPDELGVSEHVRTEVPT